MRKTLAAGAVLLLAAAALWYFVNSNRTALAIVSPEAQFPAASEAAVSPANSQVAPPTAAAAPQATAQPVSLLVTQGEVPPTQPPAAPLAPEAELENMRRMVRQYGDMFGGNPVGTNPEITSQLSGDNPKHIDFIAADGNLRINGEGELVDSWGTPYFFHQISATETEIHSAGPDKVMWTADDLVVK